MDPLVLIIETEAVVHALWLVLKPLWLWSFSFMRKHCNKQHVTITAVSVPVIKIKHLAVDVTGIRKSMESILLPRRRNSTWCSPHLNCAAKMHSREPWLPSAESPSSLRSEHRGEALLRTSPGLHGCYGLRPSGNGAARPVVI